MLNSIRPNLPPAADIYDLDTEQLHRTLHTVKSYIRSYPNTEQSSPEDQDWMEKATYIRQLIDTEIQQRKSVESFGNMCMNYKPEDNPFDFLKRFDDFNRQLQKLVQEAEQAKSVSPTPPEIIPKHTTLPPIDKHQTTSSTVTQESTKVQDLTKSTHSHFTSERSEKSVKMGLNSKKRKSQTNEMMFKLLAKTQINTDNRVTIGKGVHNKKIEVPKHPGSIEMKDQRNSHINQQSKDSHGKEKMGSRTSQSKIQTSSKTEEIQKRKEEALKTMQKTGASQKQHKKTSKATTNKDLIAMIRLEEEDKKNKTTKAKQQPLKPTKDNKESQIEEHILFQPRSLKQLNDLENQIEQPKYHTHQNLNNQASAPNGFESTSNISSQSDKKERQKYNIQKDIRFEQSSSIKEEQCEESIERLPDKLIPVKHPAEVLSKIIIKPTSQQANRQSTHIKIDSPVLIVQSGKNTQRPIESTKQMLKEKSSKELKKTQNLQQAADEIIEDIKQQDDTQQTEGTRRFQLKGRLIRTSTASSKQSNKNLLSEASRAESAISHTLIDKSAFSNVEKRIESAEDDNDQPIYPTPKKEFSMREKQVKDCYSEDYWIKVKSDAMDNLQRLKKDRQDRELQKLIVNDQVNKALSEIQDYKSQAADIINKQSEQIPDKIEGNPGEQSPNLETAVQPPQQPKKPTKPKVKKIKKQQKPVVFPLAKPLPAHIQNYLDIYPTFNHLFSVYYLKPAAQAILDINTIMRQIYAIFGIHRQVMQSNNYRKPLFTPFDNYNTVYINEPRQLLTHAQTTHIDIKTMIARLSAFNENLHGRFDEDSSTMHYRVVKNREEVYDIVTTTFLRVKGWRELPHGMNLRTSWNLFWTWAKPQLDLNKLLVFQKVNHFPLNKNLSRKDLLYKNIETFKRQFRIPINFLPLTFNLPKQYSQFSAKFHEDQMFQQQNNIWIMKPIGKSRGRGIKLINNMVEVTCTDNIVVQKYLKNPLLLDGYKFDMRIYVLVTSIHPLEAFVYKEGFARLSTQKYSLDADSIKNTFIHLTNFAIQKNNRQAGSNFQGGSKLSLKVLQEKLAKLGVKWSIIWDKVHDIILKSLLACSMSMPKFPSAFELFGYDIMMDQDLNCYLIEVNSSPSLQRSYMIDQLIKQTLIDDIIELLDSPNFDRKECCEVFTERLARKGAPTTTKEDNIDIARILRFKPMRKVGEMPEKMGLFERVAPEKKSQELEKAVQARFNPNIRYLDN